MEIDDIKLRLKESPAARLGDSLEDEPLKISMGISNGEVVVLFSKPVTGLRFTKKDAREFSMRINKEALK